MNLNQMTMNNRNNFKPDTIVVCIDCLSEYHVNKIKDWCDNGQTAICPYCWDDTVILSPKLTNVYTNDDIIKYRQTFINRETIYKQITFVDDITHSFYDC